MPSASALRWLPVEKRDTTPDAAAIEARWWLSLEPRDRADWWFDRQHQFNVHRYNLLAARNPGASEAELLALWTEQSYRGTVPDAFLDRALAAIRAGDGGAPPSVSAR